MCQWRFIDCNKCTIAVGNDHSRGGSACVGTGRLGQAFMFSPQFCYESKTTVKKKKEVYLKIKVELEVSALFL